MQSKSALIEQLRGVAILLVILYHYTNRIDYPYMGASAPPIFEFFNGKFGVYLFFIISGYLIAKTLESCASVGEFYARRVSRLWPLFIAASLLAFCWGKVFPTPYVPEGEGSFSVQGLTLFDLVGSTLFLNNLGFRWSDGAFWSILAELKFYVMAGLFAFFFRQRFVQAFMIFAMIMGSIEFFSALYLGGGEYTPLNRILHGVFLAHYLPIFAIGMAMYQQRYTMLFVALVGLCLTQGTMVALTDSSFSTLGMAKSLLFFAVFIALDSLILKNRICAFFGKYSYSLYLFHQVIGLSIILMLAPHVGYTLAIIGALAFVIPLAVTLSHLVEWRYRKAVTALLYRASMLVGLHKLLLPTAQKGSLNTDKNDEQEREQGAEQQQQQQRHKESKILVFPADQRLCAIWGGLHEKSASQQAS